MFKDIMPGVDMFFDSSKKAETPPPADTIEQDPIWEMQHQVTTWLFWTGLITVGFIMLWTLLVLLYTALPGFGNTRSSDDTDYWQDEEITQYVQDKYCKSGGEQTSRRRKTRGHGWSHKKVRSPARNTMPDFTQDE